MTARGTLIAVTAPKSGVGKPAVAQLLAGALARVPMPNGRARRVVVVDLDTRDGQVAALFEHYRPDTADLQSFGMRHEGWQWTDGDLLSVLGRHRALGVDALVQPPRQVRGRGLDAGFHERVVGALRRTHDTVVADTGYAPEDPIRDDALRAADGVLVVASGQEPDAPGALRAVGAVPRPARRDGPGGWRQRGPDGRVGVVLNSAADPTVGPGMLAAGVPVVGVIPGVRDVLTATSTWRPERFLVHPVLGPAWAALAGVCAAAFDPGGPGVFRVPGGA